MLIDFRQFLYDSRKTKKIEKNNPKEFWKVINSIESSVKVKVLTFFHNQKLRAELWESDGQ